MEVILGAIFSQISEASEDRYQTSFHSHTKIKTLPSTIE